MSLLCSECQDCGNYVCVTSYTSNHLSDDVPIGSILRNVSVRRIQDNVYLYTRCWKTSHSITVYNICHLTGSNWMSKIERMFEICDIPSGAIISMFNYAYDAIQIHFLTQNAQIFCRNKINQFLDMYFKNQVFIH